MSGTTEYIVKGGTHLYPSCGKAFQAVGIKKIGVIGWYDAILLLCERELCLNFFFVR